MQVTDCTEDCIEKYELAEFKINVKLYCTLRWQYDSQLTKAEKQIVQLSDESLWEVLIDLMKLEPIKINNDEVRFEKVRIFVRSLTENLMSLTDNIDRSTVQSPKKADIATNEMLSLRRLKSIALLYETSRNGFKLLQNETNNDASKSELSNWKEKIKTSEGMKSLIDKLNDTILGISSYLFPTILIYVEDEIVKENKGSESAKGSSSQNSKSSGEKRTLHVAKKEKK